MSERQRLRNRREKRGYPFQWTDPVKSDVVVSLHLDVCFYEDGRAGEIFLKPRGGMQAGSLLMRIIDDAASSISLHLQHGETPERLADFFGRLGGYPQVDGQGGEIYRGPPASIYGALCEFIARAEREYRNEAATASLKVGAMVTVDWPGGRNHGARAVLEQFLEHEALGRAAMIVYSWGVKSAVPLTHLRPAEDLTP